MATTAKFGVILLTLLLVWIVVYYQLVAPAMEEPQPPSGLTLTSGDTIGISPDETSGNSSITSSSQEKQSQQVNDNKDTSSDQGKSNPNSGINNNLNTAPQQSEAEEESASSNKPINLPPPPPTTPYTVKHGDTMQTIAKEWFGSYDKWVLISQENPLADPQKLKVGQVLRLPKKNTRLESIPTDLYKELTKEIEYTVSSGDTLSGIARQFYGKAYLYTVILKANQDRIRDADSLVVGMKLRIPKYQQPAD